MPLNAADVFSEDRITDIKSRRKEDVLDELIELLATSPNVTDKAELRQKIFEREKITSTGVGVGIAIPHVKIPSIRDFVIAVGRSREGLDFESLDKQPTHIIVMLGCNNSQSGDFLRVLAKLVTRLKEKSVQARILEAATPAEVRDIFIQEEGVLLS